MVSSKNKITLIILFYLVFYLKKNMKNISLKIILSLLFCMGNICLQGQAATVLATPISCLDVCDGTITVTIDPDQLDSGTDFPFFIEYENKDNGDWETFTMNSYEIVFSDLCRGNYDIDITLVEDENEICGIELESKIITTPYKADYSLSFSPGSEPLLRNATFELNNPIPGENIMFNLYSVSDQEELCFGLLSEMFTFKFCDNLKSAYEYCAIFTRPNGCQFQRCFIVPGSGQTCENQLNITLESSTDECKDLADGSLEVSVELNECTEYNIAWTSGDIGLVADNLKEGNYCVTAISKDCENCRTVKCFDVGSVAEDCDSDVSCKESLLSEIKNKKITIEAESIFNNTSTFPSNCENGSVNFDISNSSFDKITVSLQSSPSEECLINLENLQLNQNNLTGSFEINCGDPTEGKKCAGTYCFIISNTDDLSCEIKICRKITFCEGKARDAKEIACLDKEGGGQTGGNNLEATPAETVPADKSVLELITVTDETSITLTRIFPNPFNTEINVNLETRTSQQVEVILTDMYGRNVYGTIKNITKGVNSLRINPGENLASGIYALTIIDRYQQKYTQLITRMNN